MAEMVGEIMATSDMFTNALMYSSTVVYNMLIGSVVRTLLLVCTFLTEGLFFLSQKLFGEDYIQLDVLGLERLSLCFSSIVLFLAGLAALPVFLTYIAFIPPKGKRCSFWALAGLTLVGVITSVFFFPLIGRVLEFGGATIIQQCLGREVPEGAFDFPM